MPTIKLLRGQVDIYFEILGDSSSVSHMTTDKKHIVLTLGGTKGCNQARAVAQMLIERQVAQSVLIWDRRNTNQSGICYTSTCLIEEDVEDLRALLSALHYPRAVFIGSSSGARVSTVLALRHSELCDSLVLAPPTGGDAVPLLRDLYYEHPIRIALDSGFQGILDFEPFKTLSKASKEKLRSTVPIETFIRSLKMSSEWLTRFESQVFIGVLDDELLKLKRFEVVLIHDGNVHDRFHTVQTIFQMANHLGIGVVHIISGILQQTTSSSEHLSEIIRKQLCLPSSRL